MREYRWDQQNRLVRVIEGTHESVYEYDGASRRWRITEKENGTQTKQETFVWCGSRICQKRSGGAVVRSYFGNGFQEGGSAKYFTTRDHLGSVREVVGSDGTTVASRLSYDPWGKVTETSSGALSDFTYTGHYYDRATGLALARYRVYDSAAGRWLSRDPIGMRGGRNVYGYVGNDPVRHVDPLGLFGAFVWGSASAESPAILGLIRGGGEVIGLAGIDSEKGLYTGIITAYGGHLGGEADSVGWYSGHETINGTTTPIDIVEGHLGIETLVGGLSVLGGIFNEPGSDGDYGFFVGVDGGILGEHLAFGIGFSLHDLEDFFTDRKNRTLAALTTLAADRCVSSHFQPSP